MTQDIKLTPTCSFVDIVPRSQPLTQGENHVITARTWGSSSDCRAAVLLVHGLGAHSGWFEALARRLKVKRIFSMAYDHVGFGKRSSQVFMMKQQWLNDLKEAYEYLRETVGDRPIFVMGNSMGAVVALKALSQIKPSGLVMFSPGFDGHPEMFKLSYRMKAMTTALLYPDREMILPYTTDQITREPQVRNWLANDPDRKFNLTARTMLELLKLTQDTKSTARKVSCPVYMFTSGQETIVNNLVSEAIFERLAAPSKRKHSFPEAWHDLMFDPVLDELVDLLLSWMDDISKERLANQ